MPWRLPADLDAVDFVAALVERGQRQLLEESRDDRDAEPQPGQRGPRRQRPPRARHTTGIAGHFPSRAGGTRSPRPTGANITLGAQIAIAAGMRVRSAAPSSEVITR